MKTKQRVLLALLAAAVLLGAALWAVIRSNAKAEQAASAAAEGSIPLSSFAAEDLEQIEYTFNGETYTLQYSGGSWQLAQDPAYHLDESACNTMRTALMALNAKRSLTPQAGEDYGLDSPQLTVTVTAAGQSNTLTFGAENQVTGDLYVQKAGDDAIYTVSGNKADFILPDSISSPTLASVVIDGRIRAFYIVEPGKAILTDSMNVASGTPMNDPALNGVLTSASVSS